MADFNPTILSDVISLLELEPCAPEPDDYVHWVEDAEGRDAGFNYCAKCARAEADRIGGEVLCGGKSEEDGDRFCETCSVELDCSLTDYGYDSEYEWAFSGAWDDTPDPHVVRSFLRLLDDAEHSWWDKSGERLQRGVDLCRMIAERWYPMETGGGRL